MPPLEVDQAAIDAAARILRAGGVVAFPTETVYGLGANALDPEAVAGIFEIKGRPSTSPLIVHVDSVEMARSLVSHWPEIADRLARRYWPGPLTLVLEKLLERPVLARTGDSPPFRANVCDAVDRRKTVIPDIVTAGLPTVALRMPAHPIALGLIQAAKVPLAAPSANRFTQLSPTTADHVRASLGHDIDCILDGGPCQVGIESTVLSLAGREPILLRPGGVSRQDLETEIGLIKIASNVPTGAHPSPGMHPRHYSPRTPLFLVAEGLVPEQGGGIYLQYRHASRRSDIAVLEMPQSPQEYATSLYDTLRRADETASDWIAVDIPPHAPAWEAIHDRLRRAASKQ